MDPILLAGLIGAASTLIAAFVPTVIAAIQSRKFRSRYSVPNIMGRWKSEWYVGETLYSTDMFEIRKWRKNSKFAGTGHDSKGSYVFEGEITARLVRAVYRDTVFPENSRAGTFAVQLSVDGRQR